MPKPTTPTSDPGPSDLGPPDLDPHERGVAEALAGLGTVAAPERVGRVVFDGLQARAGRLRRSGRRLLVIGAATIAILLILGVLAFSGAAEQAALESCRGGVCPPPTVPVLDDPSVPLYHTLETFSALEAGGWDVLADADEGR